VLFTCFREISSKFTKICSEGGSGPPPEGSKGSETPEIYRNRVFQRTDRDFDPISVDFPVFNEISLKSRGYPRETRNPSGNSHIKFSCAAEFPECTWTPGGGYPPPDPRGGVPPPISSSLMANAIKHEEIGGYPPFFTQFLVDSQY